MFSQYGQEETRRLAWIRGLLFSVLILVSGNAFGATVIVNQSGDYLPGEAPILGTLRDAVDNRASAGDTIVFRRQGRNVRINGPLNVHRRLAGLVIQGATTIRPADGAVNPSVFVQADNVTFSRVTFRNVDLSIYDFARLGVPMLGSTVRGSFFIGASSLFMQKVNDCSIDNNHFNTRHESKPAISLYVTERCVVTGNRVTSRYSLAIFETDGEQLSITGNHVFGGGLRTSAQDGTVFDNTVRGDRGIEFDQPDFGTTNGQLIIRQNTTRRIRGERTNIEIDHNIIRPRASSTYVSSMHVENGDARGPQGPVLIWMNKIYKSRNAIYYTAWQSAAEAEIYENDIFGCTADGIVLVGPSNLVLRGNNVSDCGSGGISAAIGINAPIGDGVVVEDNQTDRSNGVGLRLHSPAEGVELQVFDNRFYTSQTAGILIRGTDERAVGQIRLNNNDSSNNFGPGIVALPHAVARIESGTVSMNAGAGVLAGEDSEVVVSGVSFSNNSGPGIDLLPNEVTPNAETKLANGDIDWPEDLRLDPVGLKLVGNAGQGEVVEVFTVEAEPREGNPDNGEGETFLGYATANESGVFVFPTDGTLGCVPGQLMTTTATGSFGTSEFSPNIACSYPDAGVADTDRDGVTDLSDRCPDTTPGVAVDEFGCEISVSTDVDLGYALIVTYDPFCALDFLLAGGVCKNSTVEWPNDVSLDCRQAGAGVAIGGDEQVTGSDCAAFSSTGIQALDCNDAECTYIPDEGASCEGPPGSCGITKPDGSQEAGCEELECKVIVAEDAVTSLAATASVTVLKETVGGDDDFQFRASYRNFFDTLQLVPTWRIQTQQLKGTSSAKIIVAPESPGTEVKIFEGPLVSNFYLASVTCPEEKIIGSAGPRIPSVAVLLLPGDAKTCVFTNTNRSNTPPVADAGPDQAGFIFSPIPLDGSGSSDADGDPVFFVWTISASVPAGLTGIFDDPTSQTPTFTPDNPGYFHINLNVSDGTDSANDEVVIFAEAPNTRPVADAGNDQAGVVGELVQLIGAGFDPDPDTLEFTWSFVSVPTGSAAVIASASGDEVASFTPDLPGVYEVRLTVSDGVETSTDESVITVIAGNTPPVADAGPDQVGVVGTPVQLDGTGSSDADGDDLTFGWENASKPLGSTVELDDPTSATPSYTPDFAGNYTWTLTVSDDEDTASDQTTTVVSEVNTPPVADAGNDQEAFIGNVVQLIGAGFDPDPDTLEFVWSFQTVPVGSVVTITGNNELASFAPDLVGVYVARLTVSDGTEEHFDDVQIRVGRQFTNEYAYFTTYDRDCTAENLASGQVCTETVADFFDGGSFDCDQPGASIGEGGEAQLTPYTYAYDCRDFRSSTSTLECSNAECAHRLDGGVKCVGPQGSCSGEVAGEPVAGCTDRACSVILGSHQYAYPGSLAYINVSKVVVGGDGDFNFQKSTGNPAEDYESTWTISTQNGAATSDAQILYAPSLDGDLAITEASDGLWSTESACTERFASDEITGTGVINLYAGATVAGQVWDCVFTNTLLSDSDGDGFPDNEDQCPDYPGTDQGCALIAGVDNLTFYCGVLQNCDISPGGSTCVDCSIQHNDGWWTQTCGPASESGGCAVPPGTDTAYCNNGCSIETPGADLQCSTNAFCSIGGPTLDDLSAQCTSAPDGSGCNGTTASGIDLGCPNGPCQVTIMSSALDDAGDSIRVDVNKQAIGGDGVFGFSIDQTLLVNGNPLSVGHPFDLETIGGSSIWRSYVLGHTEPLDITELSSPDADWVLDSVDCNTPPATSTGTSVSFGASLPGTTIACTFTNRNIGPPPAGHQPLPDNHTLPEALVEVPLNLGNASSSPSEAPHDVFIAVNDGFVILKTASGEVARLGSLRLSVTDEFYVPYFGGIVLNNNLVPGADAILTYRSNLSIYRRVIPPSGISFGVLSNVTTTDISHVGDDPEASEGIETSNSLNSVYMWAPLDGLGNWSSQILLNSFAINTATGRAVSSFMSRSPTTDTSARIILVKDGQPGTLAIGNPQSPSTAVSIIGNVGNDPRRVRCLDGVCAVSNFGSGTLTLATWDGGDVAAITATVTIGLGPIGIDLRRVGDVIEIISTGFNDNTVTVTSVALDGSLLGSSTSPVETGCVGPGHALWLSGTNNAMYTCNTSNTFVVTSP